MKIQILIDNKYSWIMPYAHKLQKEILDKFNYKAVILHNHEEVEKGDILCLLSCEKIFKNLDLNKYNIVVHESSLPKGKGWSPLTWQVLDGKNIIPITLFEAAKKIDSGKIYLQDTINLNGSELLPEIKDLQGKKTIELILEFIKTSPIEGKDQKGEESFYDKRTLMDSKLDIKKTIEEQFNLLRVCDNERYPAFFELNRKKYVIKIYEE